MVPKNYTTFKIIGTLCLATCGLFGWYHFRSASRRCLPYIPHQVVSPSPQAHYTLASADNMFSSLLANVKPYCTLSTIVAITFIGLIILFSVRWFIIGQQHKQATGTNTLPEAASPHTNNAAAIMVQRFPMQATPSFPYQHKLLTANPITLYNTNAPLKLTLHNPNKHNSLAHQTTTLGTLSAQSTPSPQPLHHLKSPHTTTIANLSPPPVLPLAHQPKDSDALWVIYYMITGEDITKHKMVVRPSDIAMFNQLADLLSSPTNNTPLPTQLINIPYQLIGALERITINMQYMHTYYKRFIPGLFAKEKGCKNLLLFDKLIASFPKVTEIVCENADYDPQKGGYAPIIDKTFIEHLANQLIEIPYDSGHLKRIIIKTHTHKIGADLSLYQAKGWSLGTGDYTIVATKRPYLHTIAKISAMIDNSLIAQPDEPDEVTSLDVTMFKKLIAASIDDSTHTIPAEVTQQWHKMRRKQISITINLRRMYQDYRRFKPLLFDPQCTHLPLLDQLATIFPNAAEIVCEETDCIGLNKRGEGRYSPALISKKCIEGLKNQLNKVQKDHLHLKHIVLKSYLHKIGDSLSVEQVKGWAIGQGAYAIVATKRAYHHCIRKVWAMINNRAQPYEVTSLDVHTFKTLIAASTEMGPAPTPIPDEARQQWNQIRQLQDIIVINMTDMYKNYALFAPLLCASDLNCKNLSRLDKIATIFPNAAEIRCEATDCIGMGNNKPSWQASDPAYAADIVSPKFMLGIENMLSKIAQQPTNHLKKIVIQTAKNKINCNLSMARFGALGWHIAKPKNQTLVLVSQKANAASTFSRKSRL